MVIVDVLGQPAEEQRFLAFPRTLYGADPNYVVESPEKAQQSLFRPRFEGRQRAMLSCQDGDVAARVVARVSAELTDEHHAPIGMLGFFEAHDALELVRPLLHSAVEWLRAQGVGTIVGPMDGDTWHRYRFNVGPFEQPPFLMEPYNQPYYGQLWEQSGFAPLERYYSKVTDARTAASALEPAHASVIRAGYRLRPLDLRNFEEEIGIIYRISTEIFASNFLYQPISLDDFLNLYRPARALIDPQLVLIAESPRGLPVGFLFAVPDYHRAVAAMRGRQHWWAKCRFLWNKRHARALNIKSLGVVESERRVGLAGALMHEAYRLAMLKGYPVANLCLIRDGNPSGRLDGNAGKVIRRYILYKYAE